MNYGRFANTYNFFEKLFFGRSLENARYHYLDMIRTCESILIFGEGDGRFLKKVLERNPTAKIDIVESSKEMIHKAKSVCIGSKNVNFLHQNVLNFEPKKTYDAVVTMFFLDNFSLESIEEIIKKIEKVLSKNGIWLNTDFYIHTSGLKKLLSKSVVKLLYIVFKRIAGIEGERLHSTYMIVKNLHLEQSFNRLFLKSEQYKAI